MVTIIQGSNSPITVTFSESTTDFKALHVLISTLSDTLKHWTLDEVTRDDEYTISCPLTQEETLSFPPGNAIFELKWLDEDNVVHFAQQEKVFIIKRNDPHQLEVTDGES